MELKICELKFKVFELKKTFCRNVFIKNVYSMMITLYVYIYM